MAVRKTAIALIGFVLWTGGALAGETGERGPHRVLDAYDFGNGSYVILGIPWGPVRHDLQRNLGAFYVDDPTVLNVLKKSWVTGGPAPAHACGYHYEILVLSAGEIVDSFAINLEVGCGNISTRNGSFHFDRALLTEHAAEYRKPVIENREFASLDEARAFLVALDDYPRSLMRMHPSWRDYDGEFRFMASCPGHGHDNAKVNACLEGIRAEIDAKFPGEAYELAEAGGSADNILVEMKCGKSLHERFDLYEDYFKWNDYEPRMTVYLKSG